MSSEVVFKEDSWIWIHGLEKAKDLNGRLGQIVNFNTEKQRYEVFIPNVDRKIESLSKVILKTPQDDDQIRKLFPQKDEPLMTGMKLIKPDNLKVWNGF